MVSADTIDDGVGRYLRFCWRNESTATLPRRLARSTHKTAHGRDSHGSSASRTKASERTMANQLHLWFTCIVPLTNWRPTTFERVIRPCSPSLPLDAPIRPEFALEIRPWWAPRV